MKKTALILSLVLMILSFSPIITFAAAVDTSEDGIIEWAGFQWVGECVLPEYDNSMIYNTQPCPCGWIYVDDSGYLNFQLVAQEDQTGKHHRVEVPRGDEGVEDQIDLSSNYDIEFEINTLEFGEGYGYQMYDYEYGRVYLVFAEDGITYQSADGYFTENIGLSENEWITWRMEKRGSQFAIYMNGEKLVSYKLPDVGTGNTNDGAIRFYGTPSKKVAPKFQIKSLVLNEYEDVVEMTPEYEAEYVTGENIEFKAAVTDSPEYVEYYVGNVCIGTATADTEYVYTLENANPGTYKTYAKAVYSDGTEKHTFERVFYVQSTQGLLLSCPETLSYGESVELSVVNSENLDISYVDYYVNGNLAATSTDETLSVEISDLVLGTSSVYGIACLSDGSHVTTGMEYISVSTTASGALNIGREYDLSYSYQSGTGTVNLTDGYFKLNMTHSESGLTYSNRDGSETYSGTAGTYRVVVSAGIAEVYRNGRYVFSFYMPRSSETANLSYSGVSNVLLTGSGVKAEVYSRKIQSEKEFTDEGINMGLYYSLEFDKTDSSSESILLHDGEYEISMKFNGGITVSAQPVTEGEIVEQKIASSVEPGYYRLTVYRGLAQLFRDNKFIGSFRAPKIAHKTSLRRVLANTGASTFTAIKNSDDIFYFEEDFAGNGDIEPLEYWYNIYGDTTAAISDGAMALTGAGTWLFDATAENPTFKWNMALNLTETETETSDGCETTTTTTKSGEFAVAVRYRNEYNNVKLVYNHNGGTWSLVETVKGTGTTVATATKALTNNTAYDYVLDIKDDKLTLTCGGEDIFSDVQLSFLGNGKFGFSPVDYNGATIDNLSYAGNGKANSGVNYSWFTTDELGGTAEYIKGDNGEVIMWQVYDQYSTTDDGATWTAGEYSGASNMIYLQSGRKLCVSDWGGQSHADLYEADGTAIKTNVILQSSDDKVADRHGMSGRLMQALKVWGTAADAAPRVFYVTSEGAEVNGTTRVYYSDDEGQSWTESRTVLDFDNMGDFYAGEADVIELPDGTIQVWLRCNRGFLHYVNSYDGGVTFENVPTASQFITPSTAFSIERDPDNESTYYIIWEYDVTTAATMYIQQPRNRTAMAVSYDGCESWEYIMEIDDRGVMPTTDHMNSCIRIIDGKVYANNCYLDAIQYTADEKIKTMVYVLDPSKINTTKRFTNAHYVQPDFQTVYDISPSQAVLPKSTGTAMIYGDMLSARVNDSGMVEAEIVARAVGAELASDENGITLTIGDGSVTFTNGSSSYSINDAVQTAETMCLSADGAYLNVELCAEIFGKVYVETESSYMLLSSSLSPNYRSELESLVVGVPEDLNRCIEAFKNIGSAQELQEFFEEYKVLLNLYVDFTDKSYENMYNAYTQLDLTTVVDYETMTDALDTIIAAEKGRAGEFISAVNTASDNGDWTAIKTYLTDTYADMLSFTVDTSAVSNDTAIYQKMTGVTYYNIEEIEKVFNSAYTAQLYAESGKNNAISLSTVSRNFADWNALRSNIFGGVTTDVVDGENVATLSAHEGILDPGKSELEPEIENGLVYREPGPFTEPITSSGVTVDTEQGLVSFTGEAGSFVLTKNETAQSNTVISVFDMTKPQGTVTGTFTGVSRSAVVDFTAEGTSVGELPDELKAAEKLTYRVEMSVNALTVFAKAAEEADTEYVLLGSDTLTTVTKTYWSVKFESADAVTEISDIGVYSVLRGVRYDVGDFELQDEVYYSVDGGEGHTMTDLYNLGSGVIYNNITIDESTGELLGIKTADDTANAVVSLRPGNGIFKGGFDRCEMNLTVSCDTGARIYLYFNDNSGYRYGNGYFQPGNFSGAGTGSSLSWETGQYYNMKLITQVAGYDENGILRTSASLYVKKVEDTEWICVVKDQLFSTCTETTDVQIQFLMVSDQYTRFREIDIKTYTRDSGDYEYINSAVNMPEVDYIYSFDYVRMDADIPTVFTIGGVDYSQTFTIEPYRVISNSTDYVKADVDVEEDKWYRFYGKVTMTEEAPYVHDSSKITKNTITMYLMDSDGNVTTLFENLPMLKSSGSNGLRFNMKDTNDAGIRLKNIRVYNGKALDIVSHPVDETSSDVVVDFLNDDEAMSVDNIVFAGVYNGDRFLGSGTANFTDDVAAYEAKRVTVSDVSYEAVPGVAPQFKVFMWKDMNSLSPLIAPAFAE